MEEEKIKKSGGARKDDVVYNETRIKKPRIFSNFICKHSKKMGILQEAIENTPKDESVYSSSRVKNIIREMYPAENRSQDRENLRTFLFDNVHEMQTGVRPQSRKTKICHALAESVFVKYKTYFFALRRISIGEVFEPEIKIISKHYYKNAYKRSLAELRKNLRLEDFKERLSMLLDDYESNNQRTIEERACWLRKHPQDVGGLAKRRKRLKEGGSTVLKEMVVEVIADDDDDGNEVIGVELEKEAGNGRMKEVGDETEKKSCDEIETVESRVEDDECEGEEENKSREEGGDDTEKEIYDERFEERGDTMDEEENDEREETGVYEADKKKKCDEPEEEEENMTVEVRGVEIEKASGSEVVDVELEKEAGNGRMEEVGDETEKRSCDEKEGGDEMQEEEGHDIQEDLRDQIDGEGQGEPENEGDDEALMRKCNVSINQTQWSRRELRKRKGTNVPNKKYTKKLRSAGNVKVPRQKTASQIWKDLCK